MIDMKYPFDSLFNFLDNNYFLSVQALHITIASVFFIAFVTIVFSAKNISTSGKCFIIYFLGQGFNGPAFQIAGVSVPEAFGSLGCLLSVNGKLVFPRNLWLLFLTGLGVILSLHFLYILIAYSTDLHANFNQISLTRIAVFIKIFVLIFAFNNFANAFSRNPIFLKKLFSYSFAVVAIYTSVYLIQSVIFKFGITPFGTYANAGFSGGVSFGATSIERGHFAKQLLPFFPLMLAGLFDFRSLRRILIFSSFFVIALLNFSASGFSFLILYSGISILIFRSKIARNKTRNFMVITGVTSAIAVFTACFYEQISAVFKKIVEVGFRGGGTMASQAASGRGISVLFEYLSSFPAGIGYGGSTFRNLEGFPENNQGIFAFLSQIGPISLLIIPLYLFFIYSTSSRVSGFSHSDIDKAFLVGCLAQPLIFSIDILWFQPMLWLPIVYLSVRLRWLQRLATY